MSTPLEVQIKTLPNAPGVYQYYDKENTILYVGKAKNLKKRVSSYFTKNHDNAKTRVMVRKIATIQHIVVSTEKEALLLENNLIKKYQPRYYIMLKDDKTYPWNCIKKFLKDCSDYICPYISVKNVLVLFYLIDEIYSVRTFKYDVGKSKSNYSKYIGSLEHQIKSKKKWSRGVQTEEEYLSDLSDVRNIIKGNFKASIKKLTDLMNSFAEEMLFEQAQEVKD